MDGAGEPKGRVQRLAEPTHSVQTFKLDNFCIFFPASLPRLPILSECQGRLPEVVFQRLLPEHNVKLFFYNLAYVTY